MDGKNVKMRRGIPADFAATRALVQEAFEGNEPTETVEFLDHLRADSCILGEWIAEDNMRLIAHIVYSRVWIETSDRSRVAAVILTPLSVATDHQRKGIGTSLTNFSLGELEREGERFFVVLGHPTYYPRFGFRSDLASNIESPWGGTPAFMARGESIPAGKLVLPQSIAAAH